MIKVWIILLVLFCAMMGATAQILFKLGSQNVSANPMSWLSNWRIVVGGLLYVISGVLFIFALKSGNVSILYPIIATSYIWVALMARFFLAEPFAAYKWLGIGLIIAGILIVVK
jgi:uncharacterized membrane protein